MVGRFANTQNTADLRKCWSGVPYAGRGSYLCTSQVGEDAAIRPDTTKPRHGHQVSFLIRERHDTKSRRSGARKYAKGSKGSPARMVEIRRGNENCSAPAYRPASTSVIRAPASLTANQAGVTSGTRCAQNGTLCSFINTFRFRLLPTKFAVDGLSIPSATCNRPSRSRIRDDADDMLSSQRVPMRRVLLAGDS